MQELKFGAKCDIGIKRRINQDNILIKIGEYEGNEFGLFVVADGMGGLEKGELASKLIIDRLKEWWNRRVSSFIPFIVKENLQDVSDELRNTVLNINQELIKKATELGESIGSTISLLFIFKAFFFIIHVGDSRIYKFNSNALKQMTIDHSWISEQIANKKISEAEAINHPKRSVLTKCMGVFDNLEVFERHGPIQNDDIFLLCSDGMHIYYRKSEIHHLLKNIARKKDLSLQQYAEKILTNIKLKGASDNVSLILIKINDCSKKESLLSKFFNFFTNKGV